MRYVLLWPKEVDPESWLTETPNEGLYFSDDDGLLDYFADYSGHFIYDHEEQSALGMLFVPLILAPTKDDRYLEAYRIILQEFECCWHNPLPEEASWEKIAAAIIGRLKKELGWSEVEPCNFESDIYWRRKETPSKNNQLGLNFDETV